MKKITLIITCACLIACTGMTVAYYNTASLGYDNANIFSFYDGGVYVLDFDINYEKVKRGFSRIKELAPKKFISI